MKRTIAVFTAVAVAVTISVALGDGGQPSPPGLTRVAHGSDFLGTGTTASPLTLRSCALGSALISIGSGSGWECGLGGIANSGGVGDLVVTVNGTGDLGAFPSSACSAGEFATGIGVTGALSCAAPNQTGGSLVWTFATPSNTNLSTNGTIDWLSLASIGGGTDPRTDYTVTHSKRDGGYLLNSWTWMPGGGGAALIQAGALTFSTTATDDALGTALSSTSAGGYDITSGSLVAMGFKFLVPSAIETRVLRIYEANFSLIETCAATILDSSGTTSTSATFSTGSGAAASGEFILTFSSNQSSYVSVNCFMSTNLGSSPNLKTYGVTLGT